VSIVVEVAAAMSTLTRLIGYVLYTNRFWYVVFVPVLALV